jgi:hypothetical protein
MNNRKCLRYLFRTTWRLCMSVKISNRRQNPPYPFLDFSRHVLLSPSEQFSVLDFISLLQTSKGPVRMRVRIGPPHPHSSRNRRLNWAVLRMRPEKPRSRVTAGVARYIETLCPRALNA